ALRDQEVSTIKEAGSEAKKGAQSGSRPSVYIHAKNNHCPGNGDEEAHPESGRQPLAEEEQSAKRDPDGRRIAQQRGVRGAADENACDPEEKVASEKETAEDGNKEFAPGQRCVAAEAAHKERRQHQNRNGHAIKAG